MTQQELDALHLKILDAMQQYKSGILMLDEMVDCFYTLYLSYDADDLTGLIDPATGLSYKE